MNTLVDSNVVTMTDRHDPVIHSLLLLLEAIDVPERLGYELEEVKRQLIYQSQEGGDSIALLNKITSLVARSRLIREEERLQLAEVIEEVAHTMKDLDKSITAAEMQSQSSFQGAQKTANAMERQIQDITYRLKISNNLESMKVWMEQRLSILEARLEDYESQGTQQQTTLASQLQKLSKGIRRSNEQLSGQTGTAEGGAISAYADRLTNLDNRIGYEAAIDSLLERLRGREQSSQSVMMLCGVDGLGLINRRHGLETGDQVLKEVARKLRGVVGSENYIARIGSDQFVVLLLNTNIDTAHLVSDQVCAAIEAMTIETTYRNLHVTVSCGYSELRKVDGSMTILQRVESALVEAKSAGGNCCWFAGAT